MDLKLEEGGENCIYGDNYGTDKATFEVKYPELLVPMEKIKFCIFESGAFSTTDKALGETGEGQEPHFLLGDPHDSHEKIS